MCIGGVGVRWLVGVRGPCVQAAAVLCAEACGVAVLCAQERRRKKKARMNAEGGNSALSLLFMGGRRRSWVRDLLRTIS